VTSDRFREFLASHPEYESTTRLDEIRAAEPDVIVAFDAARLLGDTAWRAIPAVAAGRVHSPPALPFG